MELDENERAAVRDHEEAQRQMDGGATSSKMPTRRKLRGKLQAKADAVDQTALSA